MITSERSASEIDARVAHVLDQSGLCSLTQLSPLVDVAESLLRLRALVSADDALTTELIRSAAITALKTARVANGAKLVDQSLPRKAGAQQRRDTGHCNSADLEPWTSAVDLASLLDELSESIRRYVVLENREAVAVALWVVHTHCLDAASFSPRLAVLSPTKRCGKTTLMKVLAGLVHRPLAAANISTAAVFRVIERDHPTLLIDEADTFLAENEQLRGVLNAGHDRAGGKIVRCDTAEKGHDLVEFSPWAAVAIALIGRLPDTLADRAITILLKRKTNKDPVQRFRRTQASALLALARKCRRWSLDNQPELVGVSPIDIEHIDARAADNWEPLVAIARMAGPTWEQRAVKAATSLSTRARIREREDDTCERLLGDIRTLIADRRFGERVSMRQLVAMLLQLDDAPWSTVAHGRPLTTNALGKRLRSFDIHPKTLRGAEGAVTRGAVTKGYEQSTFLDAFDRYLPPAAAVTSVTPAEPLEKAAVPHQLQRDLVTALQSGKTPNSSSDVTSVTASTGQSHAGSSNGRGAE